LIDMDDYSKVIGEYERAFKGFKNSGYGTLNGKKIRFDSNDNDSICQLLEMLGDMYKAQVHSIYVPDEQEGKIRQVMKTVIVDILPFVEKKIRTLNEKIENSAKTAKRKSPNRENWTKWLHAYIDLYWKYLALAAFRSYEHYCIFIEHIFGITLWRDTKEVESGYFYYGNKMILDNEVNFMERQLPTGFGKTLGNCFMISYIFGININSDILYVCGNDKFTEDVINNVRKLMLSPEYAKVFPYYEQFECNEDLMFSFCSVKGLKFAINGTKKSTSLRIITKLSDTNGVRAEYLFLDDITQRSDVSSLNAHNKDIHAFTHEWFERNYSRENFKIIASGTTYSIFDLLSHLKGVFNGENAVETKVNKFTRLSYADYICPHKLAVFVCVPLLDPDTDESTYPKKISTLNARKKRENDFEMYMAMDNQTPLPPSDNPFYFSQLREYESIPPKGTCGRDNTCVAALDPKRSGKDFCAMPICCSTDDGYYLVDFFFDQRPMKDCYDDIVAKIIQHNITMLYVERNTDEGIGVLLTELLKQRGFTCKIEDVYNSIPKDRRISAYEADIKSGIIFPKFGTFAHSSQVGKAMDYVYTYSYSRKNLHDDSIDSLAIFAKRFINKVNQKYAKIMIFRR